MQKFIVEVPAYIGITITAPDAAAAARTAEQYVTDNLAHPMTVNWPVDGLVVQSQHIQLLGSDEDRTPDVFNMDCSRAN